MAFLYENETTDVEVLRAQGYSEATLQAADWANYRNGGVNTKYVRHYQPKKSNFLGRAYQKVKVYFDPIQDDGLYGDRSIEFSNTWRGLDNKYSSDMQKTNTVENL